ncbi:MAG: hypothetical protein IKX59_07735 [Bacteroidales bacterium]|nr:hypothetical protein [Bacteroidales bacterium]
MKKDGNMNETSPQAEMDERIALFLRSRMSEAEADAFRAEMKDNPKLRERAITMARLIKQMQIVGEERQQRVVDAMQTLDRKTIEKIVQGKAKEMMKERKPFVRRIMPWVAAAAILCCVVLVGRFIWSAESQRINNFASGLFAPKPSAAPMQVKQLPKEVVRGQHNKLEELALLRGKVEMGLDLEATTQRLQAIYNEAKNAGDTLYESFFSDIALTLAQGYNKIGDKDAEMQILDDLMQINDNSFLTSQKDSLSEDNL